jgi:hypothetical protein
VHAGAHHAALKCAAVLLKSNADANLNYN